MKYNKKILSLVLILALSFILVSCDIILDSEDSKMPTTDLKVHFIDVGQGDSILIQHSEKTILIDGGDRRYGDTVVGYLNNNGVEHIDIVISTHPHADHIGGLIEVLNRLTVDEVIDPGVIHTTKTFEDYLTLIDQKEIIFTQGRAGMSRELAEGMKMEILHPTKPSPRHLNDASIVVRITFGDISFMFTGDAENPSELQMLERNNDFSSQILKVGHHGSSTSTSDEFLQKVSPEIAIIMVGEGNSYGHPHKETLEKLGELNIDVYRTDINGTIVITTDGTEYQIDTQK
ncbi:MBL fold metallo-hydrolase [Alkalicella caledoniensis]|uniref:MBL fold metallo-hydrolase n=1 Tax=Alkalicella caledoniensis TaxID=2731377 RepID=A0A7G9WAQ9_ALKCA|nr:ComEC/Rec2 family competence protein [Alkalicella caledoniensis]QNO15771.1 MBL fold metallo-hydrolase [Alkalicella caledoniensis]